MSAKDEFFNKLQENKEKLESREQTVKADIEIFQRRMAELIKQITDWLDGSGIKIESTEKTITDDSLQAMERAEIRSLARYNVGVLKIINGDNFAIFTPERIYGLGAKGWVELMVCSGSFTRTTNKIRLRYIEASNTWNFMLPLTKGKEPESCVFTEDVFFNLISNLA